MMDSLVQRLAPDTIIFDQKEKVSNDGRGYIMPGFLGPGRCVVHEGEEGDTYVTDQKRKKLANHTGCSETEKAKVRAVCARMHYTPVMQLTHLVSRT